MGFRRALLIKSVGGSPASDLVLYDWAKLSSAYIDTGLKVTSTMKVELVGMRTSGVNIWAFGYRANTSVKQDNWVILGNVAYFGASYSISISYNIKYTITLDVKNGALLLVRNDTGAIVKNITYSPLSPSASALANNLWYGRTNGATTQYAGSTSFQYGCRIWDDDVLVRDFKPCTYQGEAGFWDSVNETFYPVSYGSTSGTIEVGND